MNETDETDFHKILTLVNCIVLLVGILTVIIFGILWR